MIHMKNIVINAVICLVCAVLVAGIVSHYSLKYVASSNAGMSLYNYFVSACPKGVVQMNQGSISATTTEILAVCPK